MSRVRNSPVKAHESAEKGKVQLYTLDVFLLSGPISKTFAKKNPVISRTIQLRGDQTLADLHHAIFDAFGRWEEHLYEFQFGKGPMDPKGANYVLPSAYQRDPGAGKRPAGRVDQTTLDSLHLEVGRSFGYWFDFGDDWWHQIDVTAIEDKVPSGKYPKVTKRVGKSPPQYADEYRINGLHQGRNPGVAPLATNDAARLGHYRNLREGLMDVQRDEILGHAGDSCRGTRGK